MNFVVTSDVFDRSTRRHLLQLWSAAADGRHKVEIPADADEAFQRFCESLDPDTREEIVEARHWSDYENGLRPSSVVITVAMRERSAWSKLELTLADAVDLAYRPFRLVVENAHSDGLFFLAMLTPDERDWFKKWIDREWLLVESAGGIDELTKRVNWAARDESRRLRAAALFDSDAVEAAACLPEAEDAFRARMHAHSRRALEACINAQQGDRDAFPHHATRRRAIENYLPLPTLERWAKTLSASERPSAQRRIQELGRLKEHRHHYHMKEGFSGDRRRKPPVAWLPSNTHSALESGFGGGIAEYLSRAENAELKADGGFDEFRPFVHALRKRMM